LELFQNLRDKLNVDIPLTWELEIGQPGIQAIEVYPAATVIAHGFSKSGYHGEKNMEAREKLIDYIQEQLNFVCSTKLLHTNPHVLDASLCVFAGMDFLEGNTLFPSEDNPFKKAGLIWVRLHIPNI